MKTGRQLGGAMIVGATESVTVEREKVDGFRIWFGTKSARFTVGLNE